MSEESEKQIDSEHTVAETPEGHQSSNDQEKGSGDTAQSTAESKQQDADSKAKSSDKAKSDARGEETPPTVEKDKVASKESIQKEASPPDKSVKPEMRLLLLFDARLVLLDCEIRVDGKNPNESKDAIIGRLMKLADKNEDGNATWMELLKQRAFIYGQFGTGQLTSDEERQAALRNSDSNRNGFVEAEELEELLSSANDDRMMRTGSSSVDIGETNLFASLDRNVDGQLNEAEIRAASRRLLIGDINDDGSLSPDELNPAASPFAAPRRRRAVQTQSNLLVVIREDTEWGTLLADLENAYSFGGPLDEDSFVEDKPLFELLDENKNGQVDLNEVERLLTHGKPVGRIEVDVALKPTVGLSLGESSSDGEQLGIKIRKLGANRVAIISGDQRVTIESPSSQVPSGEAQAVAILGQLDANQDGYLEESELENAPLPVPFDAIDVNEDEKIYKPELVRYFDESLQNQVSPVSFEASSAQNSLFSIIDENGDGTLGEREIAQVPAILRRYDADSDGKIRSNEIPRAARIRFVRRQTVPFPSMADRPQQESSESQRPDWFVKMDRNRDGEISSREFLGSQDQFQKLDKNGDKFLSFTELEKVKKK